MTEIVEDVSYTLNPDADRAAFLTAAEAIGPWLTRQPGFRYRVLAETGTGWRDLCFWADMATAKAASEAFITAPETRPMMALIDGESVAMAHHPIRSQTAPEMASA